MKDIKITDKIFKSHNNRLLIKELLINKKYDIIFA